MWLLKEKSQVPKNIKAAISIIWSCQTKDLKIIMSLRTIVIVHTSCDKRNDPLFAYLSHWMVTCQAPAAFDIWENEQKAVAGFLSFLFQQRVGNVDVWYICHLGSAPAVPFPWLQHLITWLHLNWLAQFEHLFFSASSLWVSDLLWRREREKNSRENEPVVQMVVWPAGSLGIHRWY